MAWSGWVVHEYRSALQAKEDATENRGNVLRKGGTLVIIAVDFDGILCEDGAFPGIGKPVYPMISFVRELMDQGHEVILWTCRVDKPLEDAVNWCKDRGLYFCAVNDNAPSNKKKHASQYPNGTRKVYADLYIDDHSVFFQRLLNDGYSYDTVIHTVIGKTRSMIRWKTKKEI